MLAWVTSEQTTSELTPTATGTLSTLLYLSEALFNLPSTPYCDGRLVGKSGAGFNATGASAQLPKTVLLAMQPGCVPTAPAVDRSTARATFAPHVGDCLPRL